MAAVGEPEDPTDPPIGDPTGDGSGPSTPISGGTGTTQTSSNAKVCAVRLNVTSGGRSIITMNLCGRRTGSNNDRQQYRITRRAANQPTAYLWGTPDITLSGNPDTRSWKWIDDNINFDGIAAYVLQILKRAGGGILYEVVLTGEHYKR